MWERADEGERLGRLTLTPDVMLVLEVWRTTVSCSPQAQTFSLRMLEFRMQVMAMGSMFVTCGCPFTKTRLYFTPWVQFRAHQCFSLAVSFPPCCRTSKMSPELCFVPSPRMQVTANEHFCASVGCQCPWESGVRVGWPNSIDMSLQKRSPYIEHLTETTNRHISLFAWM
jgi:hypothetical protein